MAEDDNIGKLALFSFLVHIVVTLMFVVTSNFATYDFTQPQAMTTIVAELTGITSDIDDNYNPCGEGEDCVSDISPPEEDRGAFQSLVDTLVNIRGFISKLIRFLGMIAFIPLILARTIDFGIPILDWIVDIALFMWQVTVLYLVVLFVIPRLKK